MAKHHLGKHTQAERIYKTVLERYPEIKGSPAYAQVQISLGNLYIDMKEIEKASVCINEASQVIQKMRAEKVDYHVASICALGRLKQAEKSYDSAEGAFLKALRFWKRTHKTPSLESARIEERLANLYEEIGKRAQAVELWRSIATTREHFLGSDHSLTIEAHNKSSNSR